MSKQSSNRQVLKRLVRKEVRKILKEPKPRLEVCQAIITDMFNDIRRLQAQ